MKPICQTVNILFQQNCFSCIHKYYGVEEWKKFAAEHPEALQLVAVSSGISEADYELLKSIVESVPEVIALVN